MDRQNTYAYLFQSARLGFRNWLDTDLESMALINADAKVMEFFPGIKTKAETQQFIKKMQEQFKQDGFCYFAVDKLEDGELIGFTGLSRQTFPASFTPCIDIGWRIKSSEWNKGFATEGALRCLDYAFNDLGLEEIYSVAPKINIKSIGVMEKIGMERSDEFDHPLLNNDERLRRCVVYYKHWK